MHIYGDLESPVNLVHMYLDCEWKLMKQTKGRPMFHFDIFFTFSTYLNQK